MSQERRNRFRSSLEKVHDKICSNIYTQLLLVEQVRPFKRIDADSVEIVRNKEHTRASGSYLFLSEKTC